MKSFGTDHNKKSLWYNTNKKLCNTIEFVYNTNEIYTMEIENYKNTWHACHNRDIHTKGIYEV